MQRKNPTFPIASLTVLLLTLTWTTADAATFTVNSLTDDTFANEPDPGDGVCLDSFPGSTTCTFRAAIEEANALAGPDRIEFSVAGEIGPDSGNLGSMPTRPTRLTRSVSIFTAQAATDREKETPFSPPMLTPRRVSPGRSP